MKPNKSNPPGLPVTFVEAYRGDGSIATVAFQHGETFPAIISITDATRLREVVKDAPAKQYTILPTAPRTIARSFSPRLKSW